MLATDEVAQDPGIEHRLSPPVLSDAAVRSLDHNWSHRLARPRRILTARILRLRAGRDKAMHRSRDIEEANCSYTYFGGFHRSLQA